MGYAYSLRCIAICVFYTAMNELPRIYLGLFRILRTLWGQSLPPSGNPLSHGQSEGDYPCDGGEVEAVNQ